MFFYGDDNAECSETVPDPIDADVTCSPGSPLRRRVLPKITVPSMVSPRKIWNKVDEETIKSFASARSEISMCNMESNEVKELMEKVDASPRQLYNKLKSLDRYSPVKSLVVRKSRKSRKTD